MNAKASEPVASDNQVHIAIEKAVGALEGDLAFLEPYAAQFFHPEYGEKPSKPSIDIVKAWNSGQQETSLAALCIFAVEQMNLDMAPDFMNAMLVSAILGQIENPQPFHSNLHYKKVLLQGLRMIAVHNEIFEGTRRALSEPDIALLMIAACIHDLGHDGKGNVVKGQLQPYRLEQRSFDLAYPYLKLCGIEEADLQRLRAIILATDVSPAQDPASPMNQTKAAYKYHFLGDKDRLLALNLDAPLQALECDAKLTLMAVLFHESDIATSAGLSYTLTQYETCLLSRELGQKEARPSHIVDFLDDICQRRFMSDAGQKLYSANMARIYELAKADAADGDAPFVFSEVAAKAAPASDDHPPPSGVGPAGQKTVN